MDFGALGPVWRSTLGSFWRARRGTRPPKIVFFLDLAPSDSFLGFRWPLGLLLGGIWTSFVYLEMSFVDDLENLLVFLRDINSIHIPDVLLPCYRYGRWH